jgi:hypothetical protein
MKRERTKIEHPIWRKKVDATIFKNGATPIPKWLHEIWNIDKLFKNCNSISCTDSKVIIRYRNKSYTGNVTKTKKNMYRLFFDKELSNIFKDVYLMSYMRSIEQDLRRGKAEYAGQDIENEIPFWEFIDIEFNPEDKIFDLKSHYVQKPVFTELFKQLVNSHTLKSIDDFLNEKTGFRIVHQDWKVKKDLEVQIEARNVIYNLIDTNNGLFYIGEAKSLIQRLNQPRDNIKEWDYYRFDCLPPGLTDKHRVEIEKLIIRIFSSFFEISNGASSISSSNFKLANKKIIK